MLEAMHATVSIALRHFLVEDAAAGGHPLQVASPKRALVAEAVLVFYRSGKYIGDGLDAAMRVPRKAGTVVIRAIMRKSSSNRKGSKAAVSPKPKARRNFTPAPSIVGLIG